VPVGSLDGIGIFLPRGVGSGILIPRGVGSGILIGRGSGLRLPLSGSFALFLSALNASSYVMFGYFLAKYRVDACFCNAPCLLFSYTRLVVRSSLLPLVAALFNITSSYLALLKAAMPASDFGYNFFLALFGVLMTDTPN